MNSAQTRRPSTIFVSDLDGTLLNPAALISPRSAQLLNEAIARGAHFTVATARTPATVDVLLKEVHINLPAIVLTGAAMWHFDTRTYSHLHYLSVRDSRIILSAFSRHGVTPFVYTLDTRITPNILQVYYNNVSPTPVDADFIHQRENLPLKKFHIGQTPDNDDTIANTLLYFASGQRQHLEQISRDIQTQTDAAISLYDDIYHPGTALIEVFAPGVSKAAALQQLRNDCRHITDHLTVFGDSHNDLPMFHIADTAVAVANATPQVRNAAHIIIGPNTQDPVPHYIHHHTPH